jgi:hypothetical protein
MEGKEVIQRVGDREYRIAENKVFLRDGNILFVEAHGGQTDEIAGAHLELHDQFCQQLPGKINYLIDLNDAGKSSSEARKIWQKISEADRTRKVSLFGIHPVARILATFVMGVVNKREIRFFTSRQEAQDWLNE